MNAEYNRLNKVLTQCGNKSILGYSLKALIASELVYLIYQRYKPFRQLHKISLSTFFAQISVAFNYQLLFETCKQFKCILTVLHKREDHVEFMQQIQQQIPDSTIFYNHNISLIRHFKLSHIVIAFYNIMPLRGLSLKEKIHIIIILIKYLNTLDHLEKLFKAFVPAMFKFVAFNGPYKNDAILTEFFHKIKVPTFSIQHGIYYEYKSFIPYDIINYLFVNTDKILCWGKESVRVLKKYRIEEKKLVIAGNPKYEDVEIKKINTNFKTGLVLLGRFIYHKENISLLKVLKKIKTNTGIGFIIKPHPSLLSHKIWPAYLAICNESNFEIQEKGLLTKILDSNQFDFSIAYNTGAYIESYIFGKVSLRYSINENETVEGIDDKFLNESEFEERISYFKNKASDELNKDIFQMVDDVFGITKINYKAYLN